VGLREIQPQRSAAQLDAPSSDCSSTNSRGTVGGRDRLIWFSSARYFEAKRQLRLRRTAEAQLEQALAENKRLASNMSTCRKTNARRSPRFAR